MVYLEGVLAKRLFQESRPKECAREFPLREFLREFSKGDFQDRFSRTCSKRAFQESFPREIAKRHSSG